MKTQSFAVTGVPSWNFASGSRWKVAVMPSSEDSQDSAALGSIDSAASVM